ncbi:hypothetical protein NUACC21_42510 [Scytonema sp. NUACC21]
MQKTFNDNPYLSQEYSQLIEEYKKYRRYYNQCSRLCTVIRTCERQNMKVALMYEKALKAHINAKKSYIKAVGLYRQLLLNWLNDAKN